MISNYDSLWLFLEVMGFLSYIQKKLGRFLNVSNDKLALNYTLNSVRYAIHAKSRIEF